MYIIRYYKIMVKKLLNNITNNSSCIYNTAFYNTRLDLIYFIQRPRNVGLEI